MLLLGTQCPQPNQPIYDECQTQSGKGFYNPGTTISITSSYGRTRPLLKGHFTTNGSKAKIGGSQQEKFNVSTLIMKIRKRLSRQFHFCLKPNDLLTTHINATCINVCPLCTEPSYQSESFSSKWELANLSNPLT